MKKQRTVAQTKKHYKKLQYGCFLGEFVSMFTPFIAIAIANWSEYFVEYDGTKMSVVAIMSLAIMGIAVWSIAKKKLEGSYTTLIIAWVVFAFIFQMMGDLITDLATIMWFGLIGILGAFGLDIASNKAKNKVASINEAIKKAELDETAEQYKKESE